MKLKTIFSILFSLYAFALSAQNNAAADQDYTRKLQERADKIIAPMQLGDTARQNRVRAIIVTQYRNLNTIHDEKEKQLASIKPAGNADKTVAEGQRKAIEEAAANRLMILHTEYLGKLSAELNEQQVTAVKDGMTYNVLSVTNKAYSDMIPGLKPEEKMQINTWLVEGRELAMDAGTSDDKHRIFGKYKGKINNYLAKRGYDLQKERAAWNARTKQ